MNNRKSEHHHWILHMRNSLGIKFRLNLKIFIFWTRFAQKGHFWFETEKMNVTTELCIFELVSVLNFSLNRQFWFSGSILLKKGHFRKKMEKVNTVVEFYTFLLVLVWNLSLNWQFWLFWLNFPKKGKWSGMPGLQHKKWTPPFQSMKSPVKLKRLFLKFFCYITWFDETRHSLYIKSYCFFEKIA